MKNLSDVLRALAKLLEEMQISYAVMGGLAVRAYALPRPTFDIDFIIALSPTNLSGFFDRCGTLGITVAPQYRTGWVDRVAGMPLVKLRLYLAADGIDVDIFLVETPFQQEIMNRRRRDDVEGQTVWLVTPEDLVLLKLVANRPRDLIDIADVLFMQGRLDTAYMRQWAKPLGVESQLEKALSDAAANSDRKSQGL